MLHKQYTLTSYAILLDKHDWSRSLHARRAGSTPVASQCIFEIFIKRHEDNKKNC